MVVIYAFRGGWVRPRLLWAALPGGVAFSADITLFFTAVKHTTVANATMISALQPALVLFVAGPLFGERVTTRDVGWTLLALGLGTGGIGHFLVHWAHGHAPLVLTSLLTLLIPVVAMAGAAVFLGEEVVLAQVVGAVVVLGALATVVWRRQPDEPALPLEVAE